MDIEKLPGVIKEFFEATVAPFTETVVTVVVLIRWQRLVLIITIALAILFFLVMQEMRDRREYLRKKVDS